jgi:hypothetical protein
MATKDDVIADKVEGDEFYSIEAPEEIHYWMNHAHWKSDAFRKYNMEISSINFIGSQTSGFENKEEFRGENKLRLKCGVLVADGTYETTPPKIKGNFILKPDNAYEINKAMAEISQKTGLNTWKTQNITVYNPKKAAMCHFQRFNPNGIGASLYLKHITKNNEKKIYSAVLLSTLLDYVGTSLRN